MKWDDDIFVIHEEVLQVLVYTSQRNLLPLLHPRGWMISLMTVSFRETAVLDSQHFPPKLEKWLHPFDRIMDNLFTL